MKFKEFIKGVSELFIYLFLPVFLQLIFLHQLNKMNNILVSLILLIFQTLATGILVYIHYPDLKKEWQKFHKNKSVLFHKGFKYYFLGYLASIFINIIITSIFGTVTSVNEAQNRNLIANAAIYAIPSILLLGPIGEELAFRKGFKNVFKNKTVFIIFSGLLFGFAHIINGLTLANIFYGLSYSALGIGLSYAYAQTDNIFTSISLHVFHNCLSLLLIISAF